jgi:hypothetical protein
VLAADPDVTRATALVQDLERQSRELHFNRLAILRSHLSGTAPPDTAPVGQTTSQRVNESIAEANARRASEAARIQAAAEAVHRQYRQSGISDDVILANVRRPDNESLRQAVFDTSNRVVATAARVASIAANVRGVTATKDYTVIGTHLKNIQNDVADLKVHIRAMPKDTRVLYGEVVHSLERAKNQVSRLHAAIKTKLGRKKR